MSKSLQISNEQIVAAARAGVELLSSDSVAVPSSKMGELITLRQVLVGVATGQLVVGMPPLPEATPDAEEAPASEPQPPAPNRTARRKG